MQQLVSLRFLLVHYELSDKAAAYVSELLNDLAVAFDGQYFAQVRRYYDERRDIDASARTDNSTSSTTTTSSSESPAPRAPGVGCAGESIFTTTTVIIPITVAPPCPPERTAPAQLSDDDGSM